MLVIEVDGGWVDVLDVFEDPTTGSPRLACGGKIFDPVAGGEALLVLDVSAGELAVFTDQATGAPRLACASEGEGKNTTERRKKTRVVVLDPVEGGDALLSVHIGWLVEALAVFKEPATGVPRLACGSDGKVCIFDAVSGGDPLLVLDAGRVT